MTILVQSRPSNGAAALVQAINNKGVPALRRRAGATSRIRSSSFLVNWGVSGIPVGNERLEPHLNHQNSVGCAINKHHTLHLLTHADVNTPEWDVGDGIEPGHVNKTEHFWLARHDLTGSGGEGITVVRQGEVFPDAPLYVQYIPKLLEFRAHVFKGPEGSRILLRQKLRPNGAELSRDQQLIRNHTNGWVFGLPRDGVGEERRKAQEEALKAVDALGLDFGAVDVIIGRDDGVAYVLEVNTAPGLEAEAIIDFYATNIIDKYNIWKEG